MANTINSYFENAQMAMAAYAQGLTPTMSLDNYKFALREAGMSASQATEFAKNYSVVDQSPASITGFSGTVFADNTGKKHFAMRGSEASIIDWIGTNFGDIGSDGIAISQGIALFNWLQRLIGANGNAVVQYSYNAMTRTISTFTDTANGRLYGQTAPMSVVGHSLGGQLAMMMSRLAPGMVSSVYTYNAPGFDTTLRTNLFPLTEGGKGRATQPELLRLVRKTQAAYRHRADRHENENQMKEAA